MDPTTSKSPPEIHCPPAPLAFTCTVNSSSGTLGCNLSQLSSFFWMLLSYLKKIFSSPELPSESWVHIKMENTTNQPTLGKEMFFDHKCKCENRPFKIQMFRVPFRIFSKESFPSLNYNWLRLHMSAFSNENTDLTSFLPSSHLVPFSFPFFPFIQSKSQST